MVSTSTSKKVILMQPERVFSLLYNSLNDQQDNSLEDATLTSTDLLKKLFFLIKNQVRHNWKLWEHNRECFQAEWNSITRKV